MYSNSPLVSYAKISPNKTVTRNHKIDTVTIHCVVGQLTVEQIGNVFANPSSKSSSNYGVGLDGRIGMYVEEKDRSWCSSNAENDHRAITIEVASDKTSPYRVSDAAYYALIELLTDVCKRNGISKLVWSSVKTNRVNHLDGCNMTVHRDYANKACPGDYLYGLHGDIANRVNVKLWTNEVLGTQASSLLELSPEALIQTVGHLFTEDQKKSGILASVSFALFLLESGWAKKELFQNANNGFGMKCVLSRNAWSGSTWDGVSVYTKVTKEQTSTNDLVNVTANFRKYKNLEQSIADHSAYLANAKQTETKLRYFGLVGETDYRKAATIIKDGGYATDTNYVDKLCSLIETWKLDRYNADVSEAIRESSTNPPFIVRVPIPNLNVRTGPAKSYLSKGFTGVGLFTIVETSANWGKLKSGAGWICLDYCER